ncbi:hypothetical protein TCAL_16171 [Tigriopus californicus]|uniref:Uncharacterized protein n=1 Tax=Tigriopus californicus TaxID=6832 RepID=A0A553P3N0_TIGCA|nr:hypothetical protein TCAL_16171 [Tigriopus californicus]
MCQCIFGVIGEPRFRMVDLPALCGFGADGLLSSCNRVLKVALEHGGTIKSLPNFVLLIVGGKCLRDQGAFVAIRHVNVAFQLLTDGRRAHNFQCHLV